MRDTEYIENMEEKYFLVHILYINHCI